jgi:hypothetical protein
MAIQFDNTNTGTLTLRPGASGSYALVFPAAVAAVNGYVLTSDTSGNLSWSAAGGSGTVTAVSVASANGFAGSSSGGSTPALTISTSITGVLKGNATAISAAVAGTDYLAPAGTFNLGTTSITFNRASAAQSLTGINIDGSAGSAAVSTTTNTLRQTDATTFLTPTDPRAVSGSRSVSLNANQYGQGLFSEFKNSSLFSFTGNYTGLITYANWLGTTASTGDPSYQLAFHPNAANATVNPRLKFRAGIDTTWGAWGEVSHTAVTDLNIRHNSIGVNVAASANAGQISTTTAGNTNIVISNTSGVDRYFLTATGAVNSFTIYENGNVPYLNSYSGMSLRANQNGGSAGSITLSGGTVLVSGQLLDVVATTPATTNAIRVKSNLAYLSPAGTSTITSKMLDAGTLSFEGTVGQLFSITNSMTGTIFSVNDISGIPSIEVLDTGVVKLAQYSGFVAYGVSPSLTATGATQGTALALFRSLNNVTTVAASTGVVFPTATAGMRIVIRNGGANALNIYPAVGGQINSLGTNIAFSLPISTVLEFVAFSTTQWYTMNTTYA